MGEVCGVERLVSYELWVGQRGVEGTYRVEDDEHARAGDDAGDDEDDEQAGVYRR